MTSSIGWIALDLLVWTAAQGLAAWYVVRRLRRSRRHLPALPSPLAILEDRVAAGRMTAHQFTKAAAALHRHDLDQ